MTSERPRNVSDDEWLCTQARADIPIPDGAQTIAVVVLRNRREPWRAPDVRVFVGDDPDPEDQAERAAWDHYQATGDRSHVETAWSWPDAGEPLAVNCVSHCPGPGEIKAGFRFPQANREMWSTP